MKDNKASDIKIWATVATVIAFVCAIGWYNSQPSQSNISSDSSSEVQQEDYINKITEYKDALSEANSTIEESGSCVDDAFTSLDEGYYDDALSQLDSCRYDTVSEPSDI